jgi:hypothetical protein
MTKEPEHIDLLLNAYEEKLKRVISALENFSKDLEGISIWLKRDKGELGSQKRRVIQEKIATVQTEIEKQKNELRAQKPTQGNYQEIRKELEQRLNHSVLSAKTTTLFKQAEMDILNTHKNPTLYKWTGKTLTTTTSSYYKSVETTYSLLGDLRSKTSSTALFKARLNDIAPPLTEVKPMDIEEQSPNPTHKP